jgi:hypothetical protein
MQPVPVPVPDKDVSVTVSGKTITVTVLFSPTPQYDPMKSQVTITAPDGHPIPLSGSGKKIDGGAQFQTTITDAGVYTVNVVCSDKTFPGTVSVSDTPSGATKVQLQAAPRKPG